MLTKRSERQVTDMSHPGPSAQNGSTASSALAHSPAQNSPLASPPATSITSTETAAQREREREREKCMDSLRCDL
ncbi:hypothetical protein B0A54_02147 [Friedmanniomyces endolithicus]|uniref:Uncharacterized protein n=1 Tax=Friedmanniomyces endolithicus TaxID=329885 RepID=A0A4U0VFS7_9PEZI|nr:hypothetical protein B0A54_02147 [Friedmanniomyces endolithicus]